MIHRAPNVLTSMDKKQHGRRRRILAQGLSDAALRRYEPTIKVHVDKLCQQMKGKDTSSDWSEPRNLGKWGTHFLARGTQAILYSKTNHGRQRATSPSML